MVSVPDHGRRHSSDPIAAVGHGLDDRWVAELGPQTADGHLDGLGERVGHLVPHSFEQLSDGEHPSLGGEQAFEDGELFGAEREGLASPGGDPAGRVEERSPWTRTGGSEGEERRPRAWMRATSSAKANGFGR